MQCQSCKAEWNLSNSTSKQKITVCPFCGANLLTGTPKNSDDITIEGVIHSFVLKYGKEIYSNENEIRFKSLLSDLGSTFLKEQKTLKVAISEKIPSIMLKNDDKNDVEKKRILSNYKDKLVEDVGLMENRVVEALNTLAYGLDWNIKIETNSKKKSNSTKTIKKKTLVNNTNNSTTEHSEDSNENAKSIDYKNAFINGKHFVYITDSSELLCPNCHMSADPDATLCYNCNTSFVCYPSSNSDEDKKQKKQAEISTEEIINVESEYLKKLIEKNNVPAENDSFERPDWAAVLGVFMGLILLCFAVFGIIAQTI